MREREREEREREGRERENLYLLCIRTSNFPLSFKNLKVHYSFLKYY